MGFVILCLWCGGAAGQLAFVLTNPGARRGIVAAVDNQLRKHPNRKSAGFKAYVYFWGAVGAMIPIVLWPMSVLFPFAVAFWKKQAAKNGSILQPIQCACCQLKSEANVFGDKWVSIDCDWYINEEHEVVCSKACAAHLDGHHAERHLH